MAAMRDGTSGLNADLGLLRWVGLGVGASSYVGGGSRLLMSNSNALGTCIARDLGNLVLCALGDRLHTGKQG